MTSSSEPWWRSAVTYQIYPRSFADSRRSGMGDLKGITSRLDYLADLGVDALWLSPFYPSPQVDGGYDVADYCDVDPMFGTLGDFDSLLADAHNHGLRVIVDLIPNHSSDQHPLFQAALAAGPGSPERGMYHFHDGRDAGAKPPNNWRSVFGGSSWTRVTEADGAPGQWYYHLFASQQPDFNWQNPAVTDYFESVLRFWLDRGVDGFRIDVSDALIKDDAWPDTADGSPVIPKDSSSPVHTIYRRFRRVLDEYPGAMAVIETGAEDDVVALFLRRDEMHQAFNFRFLKTGWDAGGIAGAIAKSMAAFSAVGAEATWVTDNHDTTRSPTRYATSGQLTGVYVPQSTSAEGAPVGHGAPASEITTPGLLRARAMAVLLLALPGSAYLYAGQELGLPEVLDLPDEVRTDPSFFRTGGAVKGRDGCRVPLPWRGGVPPFGFSEAEQTWLPQPADWARLTVERQEHDPESMLSLYRELLRLRREEPALGTGAVDWVIPVADVARTGMLHLRFTPVSPVIESSPRPEAWDSTPESGQRGGRDEGDGATNETSVDATSGHTATTAGTLPRPGSIDLVMNFSDGPLPLPPTTTTQDLLLSSSPAHAELPGMIPQSTAALFRSN